MWNSFERDYYIFLAKESSNPLISCLKALLRVLSWLYKAFSAARNKAFDDGWLTSYYSPIPLVISIGNIVAGGTGKTPFTLLLAEELIKKYKTAILSRGYRAMAEHLERPFFLSKGKGPLFPPSYGGDEPYLLCSHLSKAFVLVGADRTLSAKMAAKEGIEVAIIDDGMQHRWLFRDIEIVIINAQDPFGLGYFLPRGFLRDSPYSLKRANLIVLTQCFSKAEKIHVSEMISQYTEAPIISVDTKVEGVYSLKDEKLSLEGASVAAFCGIANPDNFFATVENLGAHIVTKLVLPDHGFPNSAAITKFVEEAHKNGAKWLVCTEKDRVKLKEELNPLMPVAWVEIALEVNKESLSTWESFLGEINEKLQSFSAVSPIKG